MHGVGIGDVIMLLIMGSALVLLVKNPKGSSALLSGTSNLVTGESTILTGTGYKGGS